MWQLLSSILLMDSLSTWWHLSSASAEPQYTDGHISHPQATHEVGNVLLLPLQPLCKLWSLENHDHHVCIVPALLHGKYGFPHPAIPDQVSTTWWGGGGGQVSAPTIPNTICTMCIALWMQCRLLKLVKKMMLIPVLLTLKQPQYLHLRFVLFHCKQDFSQWYWWPGKKEIRREK